jgi:hypothetical protein
VQLLAQWLILIEAIFLMHICIRVIIKLITVLLETALAIVFIVAVYFFYSQNSKDPQATEDRLRGVLSVAKKLHRLGGLDPVQNQTMILNIQLKLPRTKFYLLNQSFCKLNLIVGLKKALSLATTIYREIPHLDVGLAVFVCYSLECFDPPVGV